jgi:hypothetical protein
MSGFMNQIESATPADDNTEIADAQSLDSARRVVPAAFAGTIQMLRTTSESFAYASTALAAALNNRRLATVAARLSEAATSLSELSRWHCLYGESGIELVSFEAEPAGAPRNLASEAESLLGSSGPEDVLIACDPWGDSELLCWALRVAAMRRVTTVSITSDQPNALAALATHAVSVPAPEDARQEYVAAALRLLVQTAATAMESSLRRTTEPLNASHLS